MSLLERFKKNWSDKQFAPAEKHVLLAVSGGLDSMAMAHLFSESGISFAIAHCNFQLRGKDADLDEQLVEKWAKANGIAFYNTKFSTKEKSEEWKKGIQETARILRYEWLEMIRAEHNYHCIVTAHHANDNAETMLMNLFKGTGIAGLHGIPEKNDKIIRPLLFAQKNELAAYVKEHNIPYREDASNASDDYLRNAIRHNIVPAAQQLFPNVVENLSNSAKRFSEAELLYNKAIAQQRKRLIEQRGKDWYIPVRKLCKTEPLQTICFELFYPFGFTPAQLPHIIDLMTSESGHYIDSSIHRILRDRDFLIITALSARQTDILKIEGVPAKVETEQGLFQFSMEKKPKNIPSSETIACIDAKHISFPLTLRKWRQGDYFYPLGMAMKKKKLSRFLIDNKIPLHEKDNVWVVECSKRIAWIAGMRLDERFKIKDSTENVLRIEMKPR
jgi:tRNA(Ile)-lysidine synthase